MCDWSNPSCLTIKKDIYIITVYLPPEHSSYLKSTNTDPFLLLSQTYSKIPKDAHIILMGDFNAHTGQSNGTSPLIHTKVIPHPQTNSEDIEPSKRKSLDHSKVDTYSHQLLQFCDHRNLTILNGCTPGDSQGQFTYERGNTCSVIDYSIVSQSLWPHVRNFQIAGHNSILSDHSLIVTEVNLYTVLYVHGGGHVS